MIETKRLFLRPLALSDEKDLLEYQSIPEVVRYIPWPERTPEQVHEALLKAISQNDVVNEGDWIVLAIVLKETEKVMTVMAELQMAGASDIGLISKPISSN